MPHVRIRLLHRSVDGERFDSDPFAQPHLQEWISVWAECTVLSHDCERGAFEVEWGSDTSQLSPSANCVVSRLMLCFETESSERFAHRFANASRFRMHSFACLRHKTFVSSMPRDMGALPPTEHVRFLLMNPTATPLSIAITLGSAHPQGCRNDGTAGNRGSASFTRITSCLFASFIGKS
jgi:hypothetical protein